ncbi:hypothetical protein [Flavihumibacter solisilvae]|uniref:hypothetical protein n=1 Tax=Flavihumibacter solisilvae TaxID=1349421 RepID=UPI001269DC2D|nr:hypothetical protein [Flavihumibacter solisilvae]
MQRILILMMMISMTSQLEMCGSSEKMPAVEWKEGPGLPPAAGDAVAVGLAGALSGMHNDHLVIAGGANFPAGMPWEGGKKAYHADYYVYAKRGEGFVLHKKGVLPVALAYGASCSTPGGIIYAGGETGEGLSKDVWLVKWDKAGDSLLTSKLPQLPEALANAAISCTGSRVYLAGGETPTSVSARLLMLDLNNPAAGWKQEAPLPYEVSHAVSGMVRENGRLCFFVAGGRKRNAGNTSTFYQSLISYDPVKGKWSKKSDMPEALAAGCGTVINERYLFLFGGDQGNTFAKTEKLIIAITKETDSARRESLAIEKNRLQSTHPGFNRQVKIYDAVTGQWSCADTLEFPTPVTTTAVLTGNQVIIPGGEIRAGVRTPTIYLGTITEK